MCAIDSFKCLLNLLFIHPQWPIKKKRFLLRNLLFLFLLDLIKFLKFKWWLGCWSVFLISWYNVLIFILMRNLSCNKFLKSHIYVTNIELWSSISWYSFTAQASISRFPLVHVHSRMFFRMIFNSFKVLLFILMWWFLILFKVTWDWISILIM